MGLKQAVLVLAIPVLALFSVWWWAPSEAAQPEPAQPAQKTPALQQAEVDPDQNLAALPSGPAGIEDAPEMVAPSTYARSLTVRRGDTLMALMTRGGAQRSEAEQAVRAMKTLYSPRKIKPGQTIHLEFLTPTDWIDPVDWGLAEPEIDPLVGLSLELGPERVIRVTREDPQRNFLAEDVTRPLERTVIGRRGRIDSSLFVAGAEVEVPNPIMIELIRAFSFDVDFQREVWKGDGFELLYEVFHDSEGQFAKTGKLLYAALELRGDRLELYRFTPGTGRSDYFSPKGQSARRTLMRTPIDGARISSGYGRRRHPILGYTRLHRGVDFAAPRGTPIYAAGDGRIEVAGRKGGYGRYIRIRHNSTYKTAYAHLWRYGKGIKKGRKVKQGQIIGFVGSSGRSTGPHLHYEVHVNGRQANPRRIKLPSGQKLKGEDLVAFQAARRKIDQLRDEALYRALLVDGSEAFLDGPL